MIQNETGSKAPIALFIYNRADHTKRTLEALAANNGAKESDLIVYSDGAKDDAGASAVEQTRAVARAATGFRSVTMVERPANVGCTNNIVTGVTETVSAHGKVIVVEDDILTAPYFLDFMNEGLRRYQAEPKVWHLSGWNYPIEPDGLSDSFFWRVMNCWGWATWADRWEHFERDPERIRDAVAAHGKKRFNLDGSHNFFQQIERNISGRYETWDIFWYATIFMNNGLCLNPTSSLVENIGLDGSGTHCRKVKSDGHDLSLARGPEFPITIEEHQDAVMRIRTYFGKNPATAFMKRGWRALRGMI